MGVESAPGIRRFNAEVAQGAERAGKSFDDIHGYRGVPTYTGLGEISVIPVAVNMPKCQVERVIRHSGDSIWAYQALV